MTHSRRNRLLAALAGGDCLRTHIREVHLPARRVLFESGAAVDCVYFPHSAVVALLLLGESGSPVAATTVGSEGLVGFAACVSGIPSPIRHAVQLPGDAACIERAGLIAALQSCPRLSTLCWGHMEALAAQALQLAACRAAHSPEERLALHLMIGLDRGGATELALDEALLAHMLGMRRPALLLAARALQTARLIDYRRGHFKVLDRSGLEEVACECYRAIRRRYDRVLREPAKLTSSSGF